MTVRISVVIPTYGRARFLSLALESLMNQSTPPAEIIVVDDCSPEPVVLPEGLRVQPRIVRHLRNQGPAAARNTGASHATGEWLLFLDDDDLLTPHRLQWAVEGMGDARAHACDVEWFDGNGPTSGPPSRIFSGDMRAQLSHGAAPQLGQVVFRREDILQFNPTLRVSEDTEWWLRMADRAIFSWSAEVGLRYRWHVEERRGLDDDSRFLARRQVALLHAGSADRTTRARLYGNVGAEALVAGRRMPAITWTLRSLAARPTMLNVKRLGRSLLPR